MELPDGYSFAEAGSIQPDEVISLRDASNWGTERRREIWRKTISQSLATIGVRDAVESLVGVGFLAGNVRHAVLCDFTVHPEHRGKGIGKAILYRRIAIADQLGVRYLYTNLSPTNVLHDQYAALGFVTSGVMLERKFDTSA